MMDSDASSDEEYGSTDLDQLIQDEFFYSSNSDEEVDMIMLMIMQKEMDRQVEHILNFKCSIKGRRVINRDRVSGARLLQKDYFDSNPTFLDDPWFHRRFRMRKPLFLRIVEGVEAHDDYFKLTRDCCNQISFSAKQKCTAALRMLVLGTAVDVVGEMVRMGERTCLETTVKFVRDVVEVFGPKYLREPNAQDLEKLLDVGEARRFLGMLGSVDCMHWQWKNCPKNLRGMYQGHTKEVTIILETVASHDIWISHAFFGMSASHNDINVLQQSLVFRRLCNGESPPWNYTVNGRDYNMRYYLADGIYSQWAAFVKTISEPHGNKESHFATMQEAAMKDVERAFGVLQARWGIVRGATMMWESETLWRLMTCCVILHNMIVEGEGDGVAQTNDFEALGEQVEIPEDQEATRLMNFPQMHQNLRDHQVHEQLLNDLVEHMWTHNGNQRPDV
nr:protein ALP1-like [Aegilops tauschii subsp. strangulata]